MSENDKPRLFNLAPVDQNYLNANYSQFSVVSSIVRNVEKATTRYKQYMDSELIKASEKRSQQVADIKKMKSEQS